MTLAREASLASRKIAGVVPCAAEWSPIPPRSARLATKEEESVARRVSGPRRFSMEVCFCFLHSR
jgi:hypothetical protein